MVNFQNFLALTAVIFGTAYSAYVVARRNKSFADCLFFCALALTTAFLAFDSLALVAEDFIFWKRLSLIAESLLPPAWLAFSVTFSRQIESRLISSVQWGLIAFSPLFILSVFFFPLEAFFYSPDFRAERMLFLGDAGFIFYVAVLVYMVACAVNLEATLRSATGTARWKIKLQIIGAGTLIATLIFYYSQGLLYRVINMNLLPVRSVMMIISTAIMAYSNIVRGNGIKVYVSKDIAYRSIVVFFVGLYLFGLGLMGEGMRYFGASSQKEIMISAAFIAGLALVLVLLSEKTKRKIKVSLHKNFYTNKYDYRAQWLKFTDRISNTTTEDEVFRAILSGFYETFGMGLAALFLYDREKGIYLNVCDHELYAVNKVFHKNSSLLCHLEATRLIYNLKHDGSEGVSEEDRTFFRNKGITFVLPLYSKDSIEGFIMLGKPLNADETYTYEDYDLMKTLAKQAFSAIMNLRLSQELSTAREMEAIGKVSAFVLHDLKNHVSTLQLVTSNAQDCISDPEFQKDMLESLASTVEKMNKLISRLKNIEDKRHLDRRPADLYRIVRDTVSAISAGNIKVNGCATYTEVDVEEIRKVVLNLVLNAVEAGNFKGEVVIEVGHCDGAFISIKDNGCGISDEFYRKHLFKPFSTTKKKGLGIGLYQCKQIIEAHGGTIEVKSVVGEGSIFTVLLPPLDKFIPEKVAL